MYTSINYDSCLIICSVIIYYSTLDAGCFTPPSFRYLKFVDSVWMWKSQGRLNPSNKQAKMKRSMNWSLTRLRSGWLGYWLGQFYYSSGVVPMTSAGKSRGRAPRRSASRGYLNSQIQRHFSSNFCFIKLSRTFQIKMLYINNYAIFNFEIFILAFI